MVKFDFISKLKDYMTSAQVVKIFAFFFVYVYLNSYYIVTEFLFPKHNRKWDKQT